MSKYYALAEDGKTPIACADVTQWSQRFDRDRRRVDWTELHGGAVKVSTVFLGLDHAWGGGPPLLWETMIFGGEHDQYQERFATHDDAVRGHAVAVKMATEGAP